MKRVLVATTIIGSLLFTGCDGNNNSSTNVIKNFENEIKNELYHGTYCNKYGALYYVSKTHGGYYTMSPVFNAESKIEVCTNKGIF